MFCCKSVWYRKPSERAGFSSTALLRLHSGPALCPLDSQLSTLSAYKRKSSGSGSMGLCFGHCCQSRGCESCRDANWHRPIIAATWDAEAGGLELTEVRRVLLPEGLSSGRSPVSEGLGWPQWQCLPGVRESLDLIPSMEQRDGDSQSQRHFYGTHWCPGVSFPSWHPRRPRCFSLPCCEWDCHHNSVA